MTREHEVAATINAAQRRAERRQKWLTLIVLVAAMTLLVWLVVQQIRHPQPGISYMDTGVVDQIVFGKR